MIPSLQVAIGPVILISGVGMLLLVMTNRFGRVVDRLRQLASASATVPADRLDSLREQAEIFLRRAHLLRWCIGLAAAAAWLAGLLVIGLFVGSLFGVTQVTFIVLLFVGSILCLLSSMGGFIFDIQLSLKALKLELAQSKLH